MNKLAQWLRKLGILRTASDKAEDEAGSPSEMNATDGGMIQSQEETDNQTEEEKKKEDFQM